MTFVPQILCIAAFYKQRPTVIGVGDVAGSFKWYQVLFGHAVQTCVSTHLCQPRNLVYLWPESLHHLSEIVIVLALIAVAMTAILRIIKIGRYTAPTN